MIFGGKTDRSLPGKGKEDPPEGIIWHVTESHWQNPETYIKTIELYKTECIAAGKSYMDWSPKLKMGDLKPLITGWVQTAMTHLAGAGMKASIVKAFKNDGCMEEIRSSRRRLAYLEDAAEELQRRISGYGW